MLKLGADRVTRSRDGELLEHIVGDLHCDESVYSPHPRRVFFDPNPFILRHGSREPLHEQPDVSQEPSIEANHAQSILSPWTELGVEISNSREGAF